MNNRKTERGFDISEFTDRYGQKCSLQKSSLAFEDCVWLGVSVDMKGEKVNNRMHLTQDMVKDLLPVLEVFANTGELMED